MPRLTVAMGSVVIAGRLLYLYGYMTNEGPNSTIREAGALPLNAAEFLLMCGMTGVFLKYKSGPFFARRKFVRRFTETHYHT